MPLIAVAIMAYLIGSIPFGVLLARAFKLPDPRTIGSGNIGATNMLRTGRKDVALLTMLLDGGKGAAAVMLTNLFFPSAMFDIARAAIDACGMQPTVENCGLPTHYAALALACAALGHMASPWLKFSGGKGVATLLGGALAFSWPIGAISCAIWLIVCIRTRYVALASMAALAAMPIAIWLRIDTISALMVACACVYAIYKHRPNIARLRHGEEPKVTFGKENKR